MTSVSLTFEIASVVESRAPNMPTVIKAVGQTAEFRSWDKLPFLYKIIPGNTITLEATREADAKDGTHQYRITRVWDVIEKVHPQQQIGSMHTPYQLTRPAIEERAEWAFKAAEKRIKIAGTYPPNVASEATLQLALEFMREDQNRETTLFIEGNKKKK